MTPLDRLAIGMARRGDWELANAMELAERHNQDSEVVLITRQGLSPLLGVGHLGDQDCDCEADDMECECGDPEIRWIHVDGSESDAEGTFFMDCWMAKFMVYEFRLLAESLARLEARDTRMPWLPVEGEEQ